MTQYYKKNSGHLFSNLEVVKRLDYIVLLSMAWLIHHFKMSDKIIWSSRNSQRFKIMSN